MGIGNSEDIILREISEEISHILASAGIFNRVFSRLKTRLSVEKKLISKKGLYNSSGKKMQDLFGIRITLYFTDDEDIAISLIKGRFEEIPEAHSIDNIGNDKFGPRRLNLVFRLDRKYSDRSLFLTNSLIDGTFEVQFRTIFSEGWHEVEHDLRYKCKEDWQGEDILDRQLNGQLATLESCNWVMLKIFDEMAYTKYKLKAWDSFFRNIMRIRFEDYELGSDLHNFLNCYPETAKELLKAERRDLLVPLTRLTTRIPLKMSSVFFIVNRSFLKNSIITDLEPPLLKGILEESFGARNTVF